VGGGFTGTGAFRAFPVAFHHSAANYTTPGYSDMSPRGRLLVRDPSREIRDLDRGLE
jgi:hypothetical protein